MWYLILIYPKKGEMVAIVGDSGVGRALLNMIDFGEADSGSLTICGEENSN